MANASLSSAQPESPNTADCAPQGGCSIQIYGDLTCEDAYGVAAGYDLDGDKFQEVGPFTCYTSPADFRPIVFQCAAGETDFAVSAL